MAVEPQRDQAAHPTRGAVAARSTGNQAAVARAMPEFVGRDDALSRIVTALRDGPSLVIVEGEAGIGKTRLVLEALTHLGDNPKVLVAGCPPLHQPFPLGAVVDGVRRLRPDISTLGLSPLGGALRPVFPEWAEVLPPALEGLDDPQETRHRLFHALTELVERLDVQVLVVEDAHWADTATLEWLLTLCAAGGLPASIVVTYRPTDVPEGSLLPRLTSRVLPQQGHVRIELRPLDAADTRRLVGSMFDTNDVSEEFAEFLHERTDGIPLAVEETVRLLRERRDIVHHKSGGWARRLLDEIEVPATLRDSVLERVERLDANTRRVLEAAAVLAAGADETLLATVADLDETTADAGIARALASGLLQETNPGRYVVRHVLDAQAIGEAIPVSTRRRLHRRAGEALQAGDHPSAARLAGHFREAGDIEQWCHYAEVAADLAWESGDDETAVTVLRELLTSIDHPGERRVRLARKLGEAAASGTSALGDRGERLAETLRDVLASSEIPASERGELRFLLGRLLRWSGQMAAAYDEIEAAIPDLADRPAMACRAMLLLGMPLIPDRSAAWHLRWINEAASRLASVESPAERLSLDQTRATGLLALGEEAGWQVAGQIPQAASDPVEKRFIADAMLNIGQLATTWGRYGEARLRLDRAIELMREIGYRRALNIAVEARIHLDWCTGSWAGLDETVVEFGKIVETERTMGFGLDARAVEGLLLLAGGSLRAAEQHLRGVVDEFARRGFVQPEAGLPAAGLGRLYLAEGTPQQALQVTEPAMAVIARKQVWLWARDNAG